MNETGSFDNYLIVGKVAIPFILIPLFFYFVYR